ncbi:MAG TPA: chemotaxis protein CheW [Spirochaetota bacterium]|jgi:purine-binding chemotaxis protein CheW|nr:chemotaxis protein CheW [Spirochaetota bacterium]
MNTTEPVEARDLGQTGEDEQYVTFYIKNEIYGVPVMKVQEIIGMTKITAMPNSLPFMKGVIDLRGAVVPVIDLRLKFEMEQAEYNNFTVIIIVEVKDRLVGMIVDSVSDVLSIPVHSIQETPSFSAKINTEYMQGIGQKDDTLVIILDVDRILTTAEFEIINEDHEEE